MEAASDSVDPVWLAAAEALGALDGDVDRCLLRDALRGETERLRSDAATEDERGGIGRPLAEAAGAAVPVANDTSLGALALPAVGCAGFSTTLAGLVEEAAAGTGTGSAVAGHGGEAACREVLRTLRGSGVAVDAAGREAASDG